MHILITGGTGLIGRHLIPRLQQRGDTVSVVTRDVAAARDMLGGRYRALVRPGATALAGWRGCRYQPGR